MGFIFEAFPKIARLKRELVITEKLDGTNACVCLFPLDSPDAYDAADHDPYCLCIVPGDAPGDIPLAMYVGSRKRWIAPEGTARLDKGCDNFGFAGWVLDRAMEFGKLGEGRHYGEWYGEGIQRGYGVQGKRFALFNCNRWGPHNPNTPACCEVVVRLPTDNPDEAMAALSQHGSFQVPGFKQPEGIVVYHTASRNYYKQTVRDGRRQRVSWVQRHAGTRFPDSQELYYHGCLDALIVTIRELNAAVERLDKCGFYPASAALALHAASSGERAAICAGMLFDRWIEELP